jgi:2-polyprenyl-3-methyl-5-hydroxy-6-metoxy-1,4-benzoquinol methylase
MDTKTKEAIKNCLKLKGGRSRPDKSFPFVAKKLGEVFGSPDTKNILDVGCGQGSFGLLINTEFPGRFNITGVEVHKPYLNKNNLIEKYYRGVLVLDYMDKYKDLMDNDIYLFIDVLEHFPRERAIEITHYLADEGKKIIASIPNGPKHWHQAPAFEKKNPHEKHHHNWTNKEVNSAMGLSLVGEKEAVGVFANF